MAPCWPDKLLRAPRRSIEGLAEKNSGGAGRRTGDLAKTAVAVPLVEAGRLKCDGVDKGGGTAAPTRLVLGKGDDTAADPCATQMFRQIEEVDKQQAERAVAEQPSDDLASVGVADENVERLRVDTPEHSLVEL